jgi:hypothetical protein
MYLGNLRRGARLWKRTGILKRILILFITVVFVFTCNLSFAVEKLPKYQIVVGGDDKAYLLDTTTGFVWILTYRTLATGREPIALPYKFIKISPKTQKDFIVEDTQPINGAH